MIFFLAQIAYITLSVCKYDWVFQNLFEAKQYFLPFFRALVAIVVTYFEIVIEYRLEMLSVAVGMIRALSLIFKTIDTLAKP